MESEKTLLMFMIDDIDNNFIVTMGEEIAHIRLAALTVLDLGSNDI